MFRSFAGAAVLALALSAPNAGARAAPMLSISTGVDWTSGGFGQKHPTDVWRAPIALRLYYGKWTFRASTNYLNIRGPADVGDIEAEGVTGSGAPAGHKRAREGFGDTYLTAKYAFDRLGGGPAYLDVQGKVRLPTGNTSAGLGVGATDYTLDAEFGGHWRGRGLYVDLGRRFLGDSDRFVRQDGWAYETGAWANFDRKTEIGLWYFTRDASILGQQRPREIGAYVSRKVFSDWRAEVSLREGLSPVSPAVGAAFTLSWKPGSTGGRHSQTPDLIPD